MASFIIYTSRTGEIVQTWAILKGLNQGPWFEFSYRTDFRDRAISDTQLPPASPRSSHFLSVNNKTLVGAGDFSRPEKLKLADNKYESQLNALRLEEMFKNVFNGATHQDIINLKAQKYTQDKVRTPFFAAK